jgi:drug/metabolite transporter (DMT)-like permease
MHINAGDAWIVAAMLLWSIYTVLLRWRPAELSALAFLGAMLVFSVPLLVPFYAWELYQRGSFEVKPATVVALAYYATIPSVIAYLFWNRGVAAVGANRAGLIVHLLPVFTVLLSVAFLGERLLLFHYAGAACIFGGIALTNMNRYFRGHRTDQYEPAIACLPQPLTRFSGRDDEQRAPASCPVSSAAYSGDGS